MGGPSMGLLVIVAYAHALNLSPFNNLSRVRRETFELILEWSDEQTFYGGIIIAGAPFKMRIDTMGDISWIPSTLANASRWRDKCRFEITELAQELPEFHISVCGALLKGYVVREELEVGAIFIPEFSFGAAHEFPPDLMLPLPVDGNLGLARGMKHPHATTLLEAIDGEQEGFLKRFSIKLCPPEGSVEGSGSITFGRVSAESGEEQITYIPLDKGHFWTFNITKISYKSVRTKVAPMPVIMDSAEKNIRGPTQFTELINKHLRSHRLIEGTYYVNCIERVNFPTVIFYAGRAKIVLDPRKYIIMTPEGDCYSAFQGSGYGTRTWRFGTAAHRYSVVTYDEDNNRIGFAEAECP